MSNDDRENPQATSGSSREHFGEIVRYRLTDELVSELANALRDDEQQHAWVSKWMHESTTHKALDLIVENQPIALLRDAKNNIVGASVPVQQTATSPLAIWLVVSPQGSDIETANSARQLVNHWFKQLQLNANTEIHLRGKLRTAIVNAQQPLGFVSQREIQQMKRNAPNEPIAIDPQPGIAIQPMQNGEQEIVATINNAAFVEHRNRASWSAQTVIDELKCPLNSISDVLIARVGGKPAGFVWCRDFEPENSIAEIYILGVSPHFAGRQLGKLLFIGAINHLVRTRAPKEIVLYVDATNVRARGLYESLGFIPTEEILATFSFAPAGFG